MQSKVLIGGKVIDETGLPETPGREEEEVCNIYINMIYIYIDIYVHIHIFKVIDQTGLPETPG